jgi:SAM-dependent methyltransferase
VPTFSAFSAVDDAVEPDRLIRSLADSATGLAAMKHYMAVAHALRRPTARSPAPVLDLGCGSGHDLAVLDAVGVPSVGVDPSTVMLGAAAERTRAPLARATGTQLPFADGAFAGCWIERVLMHVEHPDAVVAEVVRCLRPGGLLTIFEPDWSSLRVCGSPVPTGWLTVARHPSIGAAVGDLLRAAGCDVVDRVEERSWWTFADLVRITDLERSLDRAVANGQASDSITRHWLAEHRRRDAAGEFRAEIAKILWVATTPATAIAATATD